MLKPQQRGERATDEVALSHPGMVLGQVGDCVDMCILLRASGGEARSTNF